MTPRNKRKLLAVPFILFAILYFSVSFNKEYIRPIYSGSTILGIITGSFSNFMAAYIISLLPIAQIFSKEIELKKARLIIYFAAAAVFILLTIEEIAPYVNASKVYDIYDIIASGIGALFAVLTFEIIIFIKDKK